MLSFDGDYIDRLNRSLEAGKLIKTIILTESFSPLIKTYWCFHEDEIVFQGNTYRPIYMQWRGIKTSTGMTTEGLSVSVSNLPRADEKGQITQAGKYVKVLDVTGNDVVLQLLHLDLLHLTNHWKRRTKVLAVKADINAVVFTCGRMLGHEKLPRNVILKDRYPGLSDDVPRIF